MTARRELTVRNKTGLHLSSAAKIVNTSQKFSCKIKLIKDDMVANAKSVLNITGLMAPKGTIIEVIADGVDEQEAVDALFELFENRFGESA